MNNLAISKYKWVDQKLTIGYQDSKIICFQVLNLSTSCKIQIQNYKYK